MLRFSVLGSGSAGNSAVICHGETRVLIDAGLSAKQLTLRLEAIGIDPESINAVVLTHEHGDHCGGLDVFCRKRPLPVYGTRDTCTVVGEGLTRSRVPWKKFEAGAAFEIGSLHFESFSVPHDAVDPVGYVIRDTDRSCAVGILSDVGQATTLIRDRLQAVDTLFVEANYDETMLVNDTRRPWATKQRISSRHGHLSNDQTAELILSIASERLHRVVLGHLSRDCNAPDVAIETIYRELAKAGWPDVSVECACQKKPLPLREAARPQAVAPSPPLAESVVREDSARPYNAKARPSKGSHSASVADPTVQQAEWAF
ncbi:MAG: MBL fold metallo-hydrolase [Verrucomicrobiae bacterium]|nr:MBL fold metallo-hydrolase [Verrucomicrobiae bacterium]